jgi:hypothetical protein
MLDSAQRPEDLAAVHRFEALAGNRKDSDRLSILEKFFSRNF